MDIDVLCGQLGLLQIGRWCESMAAGNELLTDLQDKFKAAVEHETWRAFIQNAVTDFEFTEGIQWSNEEINALKQRGQPQTVENEIHPVVERIKGQYKQLKTRIIYKGRNLGHDDTTAQILSDIALHVQQQTGYEFEEGDMFDDGQKCGLGVLEAFISYEKDLSAKINIKAENALNIFPDPNSKRYDWNEDAEYICRAKWVSYNEALKSYPDYKKEIESYINVNPVTNDSQTMERNHLVDTRLKRIRLVEVWYKDWEKQRFAVSTGGGVQDVTDWPKKEVNALKKAFPDVVFDTKTNTKIKMGVFIGDCLVEDKDSPYNHDMFPFIPYFVYRRKNGEPYSVVRLLKDANMEINKRRSKALHLLNTNQAVFEEGAARDEDELRTEMAKPDGLIKYRKGFVLEIQKNTDLAATQIQLQMESKSSIARISGISDEAMARHSEVRSGIGIQRKQAMTDIIMSPIFDNLRRTRLIIGKHIRELIRQFFNDEKTFAILDDLNKAKEVNLTVDVISVIKEGIYDVIIEEAPNVATIQEEQFAYLAELVKGLGLPPNVGVALLPIFIRLSQLKNKEEVSKLMEGLQQLPPERPKMSLSLIWAELYPEEKAKFAEMMGFPDLAQFEIQAQRPPKQEANKPNPQVEMALGQMDMEMKHQKHQMDMSHKTDKHMMDMAQRKNKMDMEATRNEQRDNNRT